MALPASVLHGDHCLWRCLHQCFMETIVCGAACISASWRPLFMALPASVLHGDHCLWRCLHQCFMETIRTRFESHVLILNQSLLLIQCLFLQMNRLLVMMFIVAVIQHVHGERKIQACGLVQLMQRISDVCSAKNLYDWEGREVARQLSDRELTENHLRKSNGYIYY